MKRLIIVLTVVLCVCFFNESAAQSAAPYVADFSSSFKIGDSKYSDIILNVWKDWDDNQLSRHNYFSDTMTMWMSDGSVTRGLATNMEAAKKFRGSFSKVKSTLHAWVPLYSTDVKLDMVGIWGVEEDTYPDGKVQSREIHEVWWFNKDGKIVGMRQWQSAPWKN